MHLLTPDSPPATPTELSSALCAAGTLQHGAVLSVAIAEQVETAISNLWFLEVVYTANASPKLPNRLLLKWALEESAAPERGDPEVVFYRELAPALPSPPIVRCLATAPPTSKQRWIILEDLRPSHSTPPQPFHPSNKQLHDAVGVLAQLHARWWEAAALGSSVGTLHTETALRTMVYGFRDHLPNLFNELGEELPRDDRRVIEAVFNSSLQPWLRLLDPHALTVVHGDAHNLNFLFPRSEDGVPYLIDWQLWHLDVAPRDLAFLLGLHCDLTVRRRVELPLLHFYYEELISAGISSYSFDDLLFDYRRCIVRNLSYPIILWSRGRPRDVWRQSLNLALAAYRDLDGAELL